jgi:SAM-dependent methyltransferase
MANRLDVEAIYSQRFAGNETERQRVWQVLTKYYFQRWIKPTDSVLDLGAGYCEFINNIQAQQKYALDVNPITRLRAASNVTVYLEDVSKPWTLRSEAVHVVFTSNFFEHLASKQELKHCLSEVHRVLRPKGLLVAMGPNIRFCFDVYWDFFDHYLPLSDRSVVEVAELTGLHPEVIVPRFLPYTMSGQQPPRNIFLRLYLAFPLVWRVWGRQFLLVARKS